MTVFDSFSSLVGRKMQEKVALVIAEVGHNLAHGSATMSDPNLTAQKYSEQLGYVRGLNDCLAFLHELEDEVQGRG